MTDAVTVKLTEWESLAEGATEGPWTFEPGGDYECGDQCCSDYWHNRIWNRGQILAESHMLSDEDAEFIATSRTAMPALLGFVREVREGHAVSKVEHRCVNCERPWPCPTEQAAQKWLGGEGR